MSSSDTTSHPPPATSDTRYYVAQVAYQDRYVASIANVADERVTIGHTLARFACELNKLLLPDGLAIVSEKPYVKIEKRTYKIGTEMLPYPMKTFPSNTVFAFGYELLPAKPMHLDLTQVKQEPSAKRVCRSGDRS